MLEVKQLITQHNLCNPDVMIQSELKNCIPDKTVGTIKLELRSVPTRPKTLFSMSGPGNNPAVTKRVGFLDGCGSVLYHFSGPNPDRWPVTRTRC